MYINKESVIINGIKIATYITKAKFGYYKTWSSDTGYNLANDFTGTFAGLFPKITLTFKPLHSEDIKKLAPIFDSVTQTVEYDDPVKGKYTMQTHTGDWEIECSRLNKIGSFSIAFISNSPRE